MSQRTKSHDSADQRGKLRIGNDWNAITIIAPSQSNPLKAIAELVENSIDARAMNVTTVESSGLPGYTFESAQRESGRSRFDSTRSLIVSTTDTASSCTPAATKSLKLRYLVRLYAKELVLKNFVGLHQINSWNAWWSYP